MSPLLKRPFIWMKRCFGGTELVDWQLGQSLVNYFNVYICLGLPNISIFILHAPVWWVSCNSSNTHGHPGKGITTCEPHKMHLFSTLNFFLVTNGLKTSLKSAWGQPCKVYCLTLNRIRSVSLHLLIQDASMVVDEMWSNRRIQSPVIQSDAVVIANLKHLHCSFASDGILNYKNINHKDNREISSQHTVKHMIKNIFV